MGVKFNPFIGNLDLVDSPNGEFDSIDLSGDITLDDGGTYTTTVQVVTPTANRTVSFPDATGTVALVAGSSGQITYNNAGDQAGLTSASIGSTDEINISLAGTASTPPVSFTGSWFTGGTSTTTKPQLLIEPTGTTSTAWSTSGTGLGVNAASGFAGNLIDLQINGSSKALVDSSGRLALGTSAAYSKLHVNGDIRCSFFADGSDFIGWGSGGGTAKFAYISATNEGPQDVGLSFNVTTNAGISNIEAIRIDDLGNVGIGTTTPGDKLEIGGAGAGIILASPDGTRYRLTVANGGTLSIASV